MHGSMPNDGKCAVLPTVSDMPNERRSEFGRAPEFHLCSHVPIEFRSHFRQRDIHDIELQALR